MNHDYICKFLDEHGIGYHLNTCSDGTELIYIDHGAFGHPVGVKIKRGEFRPDFRLSNTDCSDENTVYAKVCGCTRHMHLEDILEVLEKWST